MSALSPIPGSPSTASPFHTRSQSGSQRDLARAAVLSTSAKGWAPLRVAKKPSPHGTPEMTSDDGSCSEASYSPSLASTAGTSPDFGTNQHPSLKAPRQSQAFKQLGGAGLVSQSIFKHDAGVGSPASPNGYVSSPGSPLRGSTASFSPVATTRERSQFKPNREAGKPSQMANALAGLGFDTPVTRPRPVSVGTTPTGPLTSPPTTAERVFATHGRSNSNSSFQTPTAVTRPTDPHRLPSEDNIAGMTRSHSSRSDISSSAKKGPPRQSMAYNALSRGNLVTSSPFKTGAPFPTSSSTTPSRPIVGRAQSDDDGSSLSGSAESGPGSVGSTSEESDNRPRTPSPTRPSPVRGATSPGGGLLKSQTRLAGPRTFGGIGDGSGMDRSPSRTSLESDLAAIGLSASPDRRSLAPSPMNDDEIERPPSALSTPGRKRERRKTVTWGGEDVLEFEREEEELRRASAASSASSQLSSEGSEAELTNRLMNLERDAEAGEGGDEFWTRVPRRGLVPEGDDSDAEEGVSHVEGSLIENASFDSADPAGNSSDEHEPGVVSELIDALLDSPQLEGPVDVAEPARHSSPRRFGDDVEGNSSIGLGFDEGASSSLVADRSGFSVRSDGEALDEDKEEEKKQDVSVEVPKQKTGSRFPYLSSLWGGSSSTPATPVKKDVVDDGKTPTQKPTLPQSEPADEDASFAASVIEASFGGDDSLRSAQPRQSTLEPVTPPSTSPVRGAGGRARSQTLSASQGPAGLDRMNSLNRPLPRPPASPSQPQPQRDPDDFGAHIQQALDRSESAYSLPEVQGVSPLLPQGEADDGLSRGDSVKAGPGGRHLAGLGVGPVETGTLTGSARGRQRITRERIANMRAAGQTNLDAPPSSLLSPQDAEGQLVRDAVSHAASIHDLASEDVEDLATGSDAIAPIKKAISPNRAIPARPPLRARAATLSDTVIPTATGNASDATLRQEDMDGISSGLDKLAEGWDDVPSESATPEVEQSRPATPDVDIEPEIEPSFAEEKMDRVLPDNLLPTKKVKVGGIGRPGPRRRSLSTGGAEINETGAGSGTRAAVRSNSIRYAQPLAPKRTPSQSLGTDFGMGLDIALQRVYDNSRRTYRVQEQENVVHASDGDSKVSTIGQAGDIAHSRVWRKLRKASDMHEHEKEMKRFWAQGRGKEYGRVFVKLEKLVLTGVPLPSHATSFDIVIDNGLERVNAGSRQLRHDVPLDLEFELVRHSKLEFKLNFYVPLNDPRNYHLKPSSPSMASMWSAPDSPRKGGLRGLFSSPKRSSKHLNRDDGASRIEPLVTTLDRDNKLADVLIAFDEHEDDCLGRLRTFNFPILPTFGAQSGMMRRSPSGSVGHIVMQMLYVPPLPNMPREELPSKSEDWMMGLEIAEWWQTKFHEGFLNQMGADCPTWRRRQFKAIGGSLWAFNDVLNRPIAEIRLTEAVSLEECGTESEGRATMTDDGEYLPPYTFRITFRDGSEILFHAENAADLKRWRNVLGRVLQTVRPLPHWAELFRLQVAAKKAEAAAGAPPGSDPGRSDSVKAPIHRRRKPPPPEPIFDTMNRT